MRIAVLSDTHGVLRPEVMDVIRSCAAAVHAGDFDRREILEQIRQEVPLYAVRGNNDRGWAADLPEVLRFETEGVRFCVIHDKNDLPADLKGEDIVICGHSHKYAEKERQGIFWLNPGSCGRRRFGLPLTMAVLTLEGGGWKVERIEIGKREEETRAPEVKSLETIREILDRMDRGQTVEDIGKKMGLEKDFVASVCRIRVTHPGVSAGGILDKLEVNATGR